MHTTDTATTTTATTNTKTLRTHRYYREFAPGQIAEMELAVARLTKEQEASEKLLGSTWWDSRHLPPLPQEAIENPIQLRLVEAKRRLKLARYSLDPDQGTTVIAMREPPFGMGVLLTYTFWDALSAVDNAERFDSAFYAGGERLEVHRALKQLKAGEAYHEEEDPFGRDEAFRLEYAKHRHAFPMADKVTKTAPAAAERRDFVRDYVREFWGIRKAIHPKPTLGEAEKVRERPAVPMSREAVHEALERVTKEQVTAA